MNARELRQKYLQFFESKGHTIYPSGSLIPYDVTGKLDESLLFNGAGMVQFKPFFRGIAQPPNRRLCTAQKCVRTGDIESVGDLSHLTFFEMMGNFSFGDYFKGVAVDYSWEFLTSPEWLGLDPHRLSFTVFEEDDEAFEAWSKHVSALGYEPSTRVFRLDEETNYWPAGAFSSGPPGPCGPNSEMFFWTPKDEPPPSTGYTWVDFVRDEAAGKWLEIWNDVFIQFEWKGRLRNPDRPNEGYEKEGMDPLPFQSVDTGMGLERTAAVLGGFKSVYDTDLFQPIIERLIDLSGGLLRYGPLPLDPPMHSMEGAVITHQTNPADRPIRIIADHIRTATFCIADGILPANSGRGYVLRRLVRRAVLQGDRKLGFTEPFLYLVFDAVRDCLGDHYSELKEQQEVIRQTLRSEEELFRHTMDQGLKRLLRMLWTMYRNLQAEFRHFEEQTGVQHAEGIYSTPFSHEEFLQAMTQSISDLDEYRNRLSYLGYLIEDLGQKEPFVKHPGLKALQRRFESLSLPGEEAFKLYDTYGFPLEITIEVCAEAGIRVDTEGFDRCMRIAQERSRGASDMDTVYGSGGENLVVAASPRANPQTVFVGYDRLEHQAELVQISPRFGPDGLTTAEFQVCLDETPFYAESGGQVGDTGMIEANDFTFEVTNTWKEMGLIWHDAQLVSSAKGDLKGIGQGEISDLLQSGFFFRPVFARVDAPRRRKVIRNHSATHLLHAALRQVLGKHVTQAGSLVAPDHLRFDFTHGKAMTPQEIADVEQIVNERALEGTPVTIHSDISINEAKERGAMALFGEKYGDRVRMVEMGGFSLELCGGCHVRQTSEVGLFKILHESSAASGVRRIEAVTGEKAFEWVQKQTETVREAATLLKATPQDLVPAVERTLENLREERKRAERARAAAATQVQAQTVSVGEIELALQSLTEGDAKEATLAADKLVEGQPKRVALVSLVADGKVTFVCKVGPEAQSRGAHAGNLVREIAKLAGGGGGGRPDFATAGGRDADAVPNAMQAAAGLLEAQLP